MPRRYPEPSLLVNTLRCPVDGYLVAGPGMLDVRVEGESQHIQLRGKALDRLLSGDLPELSGLQFFPHCGFRWQGTAELLVSIDGFVDMPSDGDFRFKLGDATVSVQEASPALHALMTPAYWNDIEEDFRFGWSLQIRGIGEGDLRQHVSNALFQLNSHYLRGYRASVAVHHALSRDEIVEIEEDPGLRLTRKRIRKRPFLEDLAPLDLYNAASTNWGDARFLTFYRVLEFFFGRAVELEIEEMRRSERVSAAQLIARAQRRDELTQLIALVDSVLTPAARLSLDAFLARRGLIRTQDKNALPTGLYAFRNSVVHAKEQEIARIAIPNPLEAEDKPMRAWTYVVAEVARGAIRKHAR